MAWTNKHATSRKEPLVFAPRQLSSTNAAHVGTAVVLNLEEGLFGCTVDAFVKHAAKIYSVLNFILVGDAATSNRKVVAHLAHYIMQIARGTNLVVTFSWNACFLHQLSRTILLHLEHQQLSPALYSITRLHQHSNTRKQTMQAMREALRERFDFRPNEQPPDCPATQPYFRRHLFALLGEVGAWDGETADNPAEHQAEKSELLRKLLNFFNGNLTDSTRWSHFCNNCHRSKEHALEEAAIFVACRSVQWTAPIFVYPGVSLNWRRWRRPSTV